MIEILIILLLGLIQGASEFLPISSSGHLVLAYNIFGIKNNTILLSVLLHIATLLAVIICYRKTIWNLIKHPFCKTNLKLLTATIPTVILALILKDLVETTFGNNFIIYGFLITAVILLLSQMLENRNKLSKNRLFLTKNDKIDINKNILDIDVSYPQAIIIGIAQGLAIFPGISRSGSTIATSLLVGVNKDDSADFSFLLSIPIIIGGMIFEVVDFVKSGMTLDISVIGLILGFVSAFLSGLLCIRLMLKLIKKQKLSWFSFYLVLLSIILVVNQYLHFLY